MKAVWFRTRQRLAVSVGLLVIGLGSLNAATYTASLELTPASPVTNWSVMLWPGESAELTITVAEKGNVDLDEYTLDGPPTVTYPQTNLAFAWFQADQTFSIVHTATCPAVAVVEVACSWSGGSGEIDGGVIPGLATGTARAELVEIEKIQYRLGSSNAWADIPIPLLVAKGTTVEFRAMPRPSDAEWPSGKPTWSGATGSDAHASRMFDTAGCFLVSAECGNVQTARVNAIMLQFDSLSIERGRDMRFPQLVLDGNVCLDAETGDGLFPGAYFLGKAALKPYNLAINWELQFKQYSMRTMTATFVGGVTVTNVESEWDGDGVYAQEAYSLSGTQELRADDSPSQILNVTSMYNSGIRQGTFSDKFTLYFYGKVATTQIYETLYQKNWGWSFEYTLSTNASGQVEYTITNRQQIREL
jgi:hypothetical protein